MKQFRTIMAALAILAFATTARASLVITEVMSSSNNPAGPGDDDWWELTNTGAPVNLSGYYWDDNGPNGADGALFPNITINTGESIVIVRKDNVDLPAFVAAWGGGFTAISQEDFGGPDNFSGLSSNGDQIELWDSDPNAGPANLVASAFFGNSDGGGKSFEWFTDGSSDGFSVAGEHGAFVAPGDGVGGTGADVGSPGYATIPEPATISLFVVGGIALVRRRRR